MFILEVSWQLPPAATPEQIDDLCYSFLGYWLKNGQIINLDHPIARSVDRVRTFVMALETDSLADRHANKYIRAEIERWISLGFSAPQIECLGESIGISEGSVCQCESSSAYILYTHYLGNGSPLRCGDCFNDIPLYKIPKAYDREEYYDILTWMKDYRACDSLQMHCRTGERFGTRQISNLNSSLNREGKDIADRLTELTGIPTYYYLYRYIKRTSLSKEKKRPCPGCGGEWLLPSAWHRFGLKCDRCRLVSNLSFTVS
jgi:predicted  nucleic acid-binding Zn ribbon protein